MQPIFVHINKLGAIVNSDIEITPVMIFSGESGLGKSYAAILCHYLFEILLSNTRLSKYFVDNNIIFQEERKKYKNTGLAIKLSKKKLEDWISADAISYMKYMLNNESLSADIHISLPKKLDDVIESTYEEELLGFVENEKAYVKLNMLGLTYRVKDETLDDESPYAVILRYGLINMIFGDFKTLSNTYIFPPSRGSMLTEEINPQTGLFKKFKDGLDYLNRITPHPEDVSEDLVELLQKILDGSVHRINNRYIYRTHNQDLPITAAAASVRELAPIAMLVERFDISKIAMLIEEPEAHLHPLKQRMMADIIAMMYNGRAFMQITTHSDYFLRRINELINVFKLREKLDDNKFYNIISDVKIDPKLMIDPRYLSAYLLVSNQDGTSKIVRQDLEHGVPYSSFSEAIDDSLSKSIKLNQYLEDECSQFV